jgi:hypothetical protein
MTLDIRATVECSLGEVISASLSDDYIQGNGLIKTQGSCLIDGLITPPVGTVVTFDYTKDGVTRSIPRKMRVLSSFADPYRRTTEVQMGCLLTFLSDAREPIEWSALNDPRNSNYTEEDKNIIVIPISASSIAYRCLTGLEIVPFNDPGLTNSFSIETFDFSSGYVNILSDLLYSESKCGYLNMNDELVIIDLSQEGGTGPLLSEDKVIDIGSINSGAIPGEGVIVKYNTLKLFNSAELKTEINEAGQEVPAETPDPSSKVPEAEVLAAQAIANETAPETLTTEVRDAYQRILVARNEANTEVGAPAFGVYNYKQNPGTLQESTVTIVTTHAPITETRKNYSAVQVKNQSDGSISYENERQTYERTVSTNVLGITASSLFQNIADVAASVGLAPPNSNLGGGSPTIVQKTFEYFDNGDSVENEIKYQSSTHVAAEMNLDWAYPVTNGYAYVSFGADMIPVEQVPTVKKVTAGIESTYTYYYRLWHQTISGQIATAMASNSGKIDNAQAASNYFNRSVYTAAGGTRPGVVFDYMTTSISYKSSFPTGNVTRTTSVLTRYAAPANVTKPATLEPPPDPTPGLPSPRKERKIGFADNAATSADYRTEGVSEIEFISGNYGAKRITEFSMPYAPDDRFIKSGDEYYSVSSGAGSKANTFGRVQNRLLLANRSGLNVTTVPELLPNNPFDPIIIEANGLSAMYRLNGTSWSIDSSGVVVSSDGLFWGAVGGTGQFWFPVAPGITSLPSTPPAVDGQVTVPYVAPSWLEIISITASTRTKVVVTRFQYSLNLLTEASVPVHTEIVATTVIGLRLDSVQIGLSALPVTVNHPIKTSAVQITVTAPPVTTLHPVKAGAVQVTLTALPPLGP